MQGVDLFRQFDSSIVDLVIGHAFGNINLEDYTAVGDAPISRWHVACYDS